MAEGLHIDAQIVARRCSVKSPDYSQLTSLDWVVLDFTDGMRKFYEMQQMLPVSPEELSEAYIHLKSLGFLTWNTPDSRTSTSAASSYIQSRQFSNADSLTSAKTVSLAPLVSGYSDEVCAQYLPPRLFGELRRFEPTMINESLDIPVETQVFAEFIHDNLSRLSPYDLLGLVEGQCTKADVKQAYLLRTKQFHPDRYFRKNIGPFAPRIAAIFKAVTSAFTTLQSKSF